MKVIKYILLIFSMGQFFPLESFWQSNFFWFFIWVICFHLGWFYMERLHYKQINSIVLCLLALINLWLLPSFPYLMLGLLTIELRELFTRKKTVLILSLMAIVSVFIWITSSSWAQVDYLIFTVGIVIICGYLAEQAARLEEQEASLYEFRTQADEQEARLIEQKAQMIAMEEIHTLNERNRISRDLHDTVGHTLSTIVIQLAAIEKLTEEELPQASAMLKRLHHFTKEGLSDVRQVIHQLKPKHYQKFAFIEQVHHFISDFEHNSPIKVYFNNNQLLWSLSPEQELLFMRAIQEFLSNSSKHSQANEVRIQCHFTDSTVILTLMDNGKGTDTIKPQMGITGMKERTKLLGGKVQIQSALNKGFKVRIVLPKGGSSYDG